MPPTGIPCLHTPTSPIPDVKPQEWDGLGQAPQPLKHDLCAGDTSNWSNVQLLIRLAHLQLLGKQSRQLHSGHPAKAIGIGRPLALKKGGEWCVISCLLVSSQSELTQ